MDIYGCYEWVLFIAEFCMPFMLISYRCFLLSFVLDVDFFILTGNKMFVQLKSIKWICICHFVLATLSEL